MAGGWLRRAFNIAQVLDRFGLERFALWHVPRWLDQIDQIEQQINRSKGTAGAKRRRRKLYKRLIKRATQLSSYLGSCWDEWDVAVQRQQRQIEPVRQLWLQRLCSELYECRRQTEVLLENCQIRTERPGEELQQRSSYSGNDGSAHFIVKGGRETIFGYKPQLAQSGNALITALLLEPGNAADSTQLSPLVQAAMSNCDGGVRQLVSVDDGYARKAHRDELLGLGVGVEIVSISGSKGKKLIGDELWESEPYCQARRLRATAESPIFVLKQGYGFGQLRRCGIDAVRAELLEKILAYNANRISVLRARQALARERAVQEKPAA